MIPALRLTDSDITILRAACLDGAAALAAVEALRRTVDIDALDWGRQRLLPLLHRNLLRLGVEDWHAARLRGVRRFFWARSELRLRALAPVLGALGEAGIRTAVLKGAGLVAGGHEELSARPMDDLDVLIRPPDLPAAVALLAKRGFQPRMADADRVLHDIAHRLPGWPFVDAAGHDLDLHWHVLHADCRPRADDGFWRHARPAMLAGVPTSVLDPTHQLLQAIAHAARWNDTSTPRWASDAITLLRTGAVAWDRLIADARRHRIVPAIEDGLALLERHLDAAVPRGVPRRLRWPPRPVTRFELTLGSAAEEALTGWREDARVLFERRRTSAWLWRLPLIATTWTIARAEDDLPRAAARVLFRATGERRRLRRALHVDRWARPVPRDLPPIGTDSPAFLDGWHPAELHGQWSARREARVGWRLASASSGPLACDLRVAVIASDSIGPPKIKVFANDHLVATWRSRRGEPFEPKRRFIIPAAALRGRSVLVLTFAVQAMRTPAGLGISNDRRPLGVFVGAMAIGPYAAETEARLPVAARTGSTHLSG